MYVCLCHAVSDHDISRIVKSGVRTMHELAATLKVGACCGACAETANDCLTQALAESHATPSELN